MSSNKSQDTQDIESIDMDCLEAFDHVYALINNELSEPDMIKKVEHHISHCKSCFSRAQMETKINQCIKETKPSQIPERLKSRLNKLLDDI